MSRADLPSRTAQLDRPVIGDPKGTETGYALLLHKRKSEHDWTSSIGPSGSIEQLEDAAARGLLDTSVVVFPGFGNVVALMQGSTSAPSHATLAAWLNEIEAFAGTTFAARPVIERAQLEKMQRAVAVQRIELKVSDPRELSQSTGGLASALRKLTKRYGDASVTVTVAMPRRKKLRDTRSEEGRELLYTDLRGIENALPKADRAKASLLYVDDDEFGRAHVAELVEHNITAKVKVRAVDEEGNSVKILDAITVIRGHCVQLEETLLAAVTPQG